MFMTGCWISQAGDRLATSIEVVDGVGKAPSAPDNRQGPVAHGHQLCQPAWLKHGRHLQSRPWLHLVT